MKLSGIARAIFLGSGFLSLCAIAGAQSTAPAEKTWLDDIKQPTPWFKWGADERIRNEYLLNFNTFNENIASGHEADWQRFRTRLWATISAGSSLDFNLRLDNESRHVCRNTSSTGQTGDNWNEKYATIFLDNLNVKIKNLIGENSSLTIGRQDIMLGDGWLILDGTPLDGSRSTYFDAARLSLDIKQCKSTADLIFLQQYALIDQWLPAFDDQGFYQMEQNERGAIVYLTNKSIPDTQVDGYFIYKNDNRILANGDQGDVYTVGSRIYHDFDKHIFGRIEGAYQFGSRNNPALFGTNVDNNLSAWGLTSRLGYKFNDSMKNQITLVYEYLSGDDPSTRTNEAFDPLWGRWPQWSEIWGYHDASETRPFENSNLQRLGISWDIQPTAKLGFTANYFTLFGNQVPHAISGSPTYGDGNFRGHLMTGIIKYKFSDNIAGHLLGEYFIPGDFYAAPSQDSAVFFRVELVFSL